MKKFILLTLLGVSGMTSAQKTAAKLHPLQSGKWYATGAIGGKALTLTARQMGNSEWEATFASTGHLHHCSTLKTPVVDAAGVEIKPGTFYCDSLSGYKIRNNVININSNQTDYYYKITNTDKGSYILAPATVSDFK